MDSFEECQHVIARNEYGFPEMEFIKEAGEIVDRKGYQYKLSEYEVKCNLCGVKITAIIPSKKGKIK
jgi:hypothetical protein